jgi:hypothetical protein
MGTVARLFVVLVGGLLLSAGTASADHLDPEQRIRPADQARAKAMLLRPSDVQGFRRQPPSGADPHLSCRALDESDLIVTGDAESPSWTASVVFITSSSTVYATEKEASASWRRGTSAAGLRCLREELGREFARQGARVVSIRPLSFPTLAQRTAAYRLTIAGEAQGQTINLFLDFVVQKQGRAQTGLVVGSALVQPGRGAVVRFARTLATRMRTVMRGA